MAAAKTQTKRKSRRKARTEVSSASSSDSEGQSSKQTSPEAQDTNIASAASQEGKPSVGAPLAAKKTVSPEQAFEDFYLRQATKEFANDLDKLRAAGDFNARSVPLLVGALKQGTACFSQAERVRIGGATSNES
ncbi:hypothetical protein LTR85_010655 [Meristemomyces frigidus]|nr:hypothetical protein LTR85_010655 [Meristemomyces frigidus]